MATTESKPGFVTGQRWALLGRVLASAVSIVLVFWADVWFESYRDHVAESFDTSGLWRWFIAALVLVLAGTIFGLGVRGGRLTGRFDWRGPLALGAIPALLAMTLPMFIWQWPLTRMGSPLWSFRADFVADGHAAVMWVLVGLAVSSGFETDRP